MSDLNYDVESELAKYMDAYDLQGVSIPTTKMPNSPRRYNPMTGKNDVLTQMQNGGYVRIGSEPVAMTQAPKQPTLPEADQLPSGGLGPQVEGVQKLARDMQEMQGSYEIADLEAAGYSPEVIKAAGLDVQPQNMFPPKPQEDPLNPEPLSEQEVADIIASGQPIITADPTIRDRGSQIVSTYFFDLAVKGLREELAEQGMGAEEIERTVKAREGELFRNAEVYSNALFGTGATGMEIGAGDFLQAGIMDMEEGRRLFNQQRDERGGSMAGRAVGMAIMAAGVAEMTGVGYAFGKLLKRGAKALEPTLVRMGEEAQGRIDAEGTTLFSNPVGPIVDRGLAAAGRVAKVEAPTETKSGIIAFHGSGSDFNEFSLDMIGTGEGNQSFGYGLYFTDVESIADFYKDAVREESNFIHLDGKPLDSVYSADNEEKFSEYISANFEPDEFNDAYMVLDNLGQGIGSVEDADSMAASSLTRSQMKIYGRIREDLEVPELPEGVMYQVNLLTNKENLLDWNEEQSPEILEKAMSLIDGRIEVGENIRDKFFIKVKAKDGETKTVFKIKDFDTEEDALTLQKAHGADILRIVEAIEGSPEAAARALNAAGIPGVKYRAAGSRGSDIVRDQAKNNYVIFDDKLIDIMKKYGIVGPVAVTAMKSEEQEET